MSELINTRSGNENFRRDLLINVCALALMGFTGASSVAFAAALDEDRPTVWIEIGGQLERVDTPQTAFAPPFFTLAQPKVLDAMVDAMRPSRYSIGGEGKITFTPVAAADWVFAAAIRYGRSSNNRHKHYQTAGLPTFTNIISGGNNVVKPGFRQFGDGQSGFAESHAVLDFQVGKDVGLGLFGHNASSVVSAGVRFAQFTSSSSVVLHARPILGYSPPIASHSTFAGRQKYNKVIHGYHQSYTALLHTRHSTHAVGPSFSWDMSLPVAGNQDGMSIAFDWGVNGAVLFGRQRSHEDHQTTGYYLHFNGKVKTTRHYAHPNIAHDRSQSVTIPNAGGFAGLSLKFPSARFSMGYRGDFFLNATDSGLDARDAARRNFYGPFATFSIGLGG